MAKRTHLKLKKFGVQKSAIRATFEIDLNNHDPGEILNEFCNRRIVGTLFVGDDPDQQTIEDFDTGLKVKSSFDCGKVSFGEDVATFGVNFNHRMSEISQPLTADLFQELITRPAVFEIEENTGIPKKEPKESEPDSAQSQIPIKDDELNHEDVLEEWRTKSIAVLSFPEVQESQLKTAGIETLNDLNLFVESQHPSVDRIEKWGKARIESARKKLYEFVKELHA